MYKRVDANMFAKKLIEMEDDSSVVFATACEKKMEIGETDGDEDAFHYFYYAKKVWEKQYDSWYIVIDYMTSGEAHVIPLRFCRDNENLAEVLKHVQQFMQDWIPEIYLEVEE